MDAVIQRISDKSEYLPCACAIAEPIPLTEDILKVNGFRESIEEGTYYFPNDYDELHNRGYAVETDGNGVWYVTDHNLMLFSYVHQFQHILRCCGLDNLADNFNVTL